MKWPWTRDPEPPLENDQEGVDEAHEALESALDMWHEVRRVTEQVRTIRRRNHLAEITVKALRSSR